MARRRTTLWLSLAGLVVLVPVLGVLGAGALLPERHQASASIAVAADADTAWRLLTDIAGYAAWRSDVERAEPLPDRAGMAVWLETSPDGEAIAYATLERSDRERRLVRRIVTEGLPYEGTWTLEVLGTPEGTVIRITEDGRVPNPLIRFVAYYLIGHTTRMEQVLADAGRVLSE